MRDLKHLIWIFVALSTFGWSAAPTIEGVPDTNAIPGQNYVYQPTAADADGDTLTFVIKNQPSWTNFDSTTGRLSGIPSVSDRGEYSNVNIGVTDGTTTTWGNPMVNIGFTLVVDTPPTIEGVPETHVIPGEAYVFQSTAADADGDPLTFVINNKPVWANFDSTTGRLSGTPSTSDRGEYPNINIGVSDGLRTTWGNPVINSGFTLVVNTLPVISGTPLTSIRAGQTYSFTPTASDSDNDTLIFMIRNKPSWATFDPADGTLSGTPQADDRMQYNEVIIAVSDGLEESWIPAFNLRVENNPPVISGTPDPVALVGTQYRFTPTVSDSDGDAIHFRIINKPPGTTFNTETGELSAYAPETAIDMTAKDITIIAIDEKYAQAQLPPFSVTVRNAKYFDAPELLGTPSTSAIEGESYSFLPKVHYYGEGRVVYSIENKPSWTEFSTNTGKLSGIPHAEDVGTSDDIVITAHAGNGTTSSYAPFKITITSTQASSREAFNLLLHASFGPTEASIREVMDMGIEAWVENQLSLPSAYDSKTDGYLTYLERYIQIAQTVDPDNSAWNSATIAEYTAERTDEAPDVAVFKFGPKIFPSVWFENVLHDEDQLRQRVAFALSQILVIDGVREGAASFYDILVKDAFTNYRDLLIDVTFSAEMCKHLTYSGSRGDDPKYHADENYARELMQLFTIGLHRMYLDGTPVYNNGALIENYTSSDIEQIARVFTGWDLYGNQQFGRYSVEFADNTRPIHLFSNGIYHDYGEKEITLEGYGTTISGADPRQEITDVIDNLMQHPNTAPFISKQLIMRLVTSNPSPAYVARIASVFNDNGRGVKGDLKSVVRAILLDPEARSIDPLIAKKVKEPLLAYTQFLRTFDVGYAPVACDASLLGGKSGLKVSNIYVFKSDFQMGLGEGPLTSPTVFNFYDNSFVPNDAGFRDNALVSPEFQIVNEQSITFLSNLFFEALYAYNKDDHMVSRGLLPIDWFSLSFDDELAIVLDALDGDYANLTDETYGEKALDAIIAHFNTKLVKGTLKAAQIVMIKSYIVTLPTDGTEKNARRLISIVARLILATQNYMIQK